MDARIKTQDSRHSEPDKTLTKIASFSRSKKEKELIQMYRAIPIERQKNVDVLLSSFYKEIAIRKSTAVYRSVVSMEGWKHGCETD